jgi:hypothetical protein
VVVFWTGYQFGLGQQSGLIPDIRHMNDPSHLEGDWLVQLGPRHYAVVLVLSLLAHLVPLEALFLSLHACVIAAFLCILRRLALLFFHSEAVFCLALFLLLRWGTAGLGGSVLFEAYTAAHHIAVPICMGAFYLSLRQRPYGAAILAGLATNVHMLLGLNTFVVLAVCHMVNGHRPAAKTALRSLCLYALVSTPSLLPTLLLLGETNILSSQDFVQIHARLRHPHHYLPSSWPLGDYLRFGFAPLFAIATFRGKANEQEHRTVVTWCVTILIACVVAALFVDLVPNKLVTKLQLFRMTIFVQLFGILYVANYLHRILEVRNRVMTLATFALFAAGRTSHGLHFFLAALLIALDPQSRRRVAPLAIAFAVLGVTVYSSVAPQSLSYLSALAVQPVAWVRYAVAAGLLTTLAWVSRRAAPSWFNAPSWVPVLFVFLVLFRCVTGCTFQYNFQALARNPRLADWVELCTWVRVNTPPDARFLTPPHRAGFRLLAERAIVVDFKETTVWETGIAEWKRRLDDLSGSGGLSCSGTGSCLRTLRAGYQSLTSEDFRRIARRYGAGYIIAERPMSLPFPVLYSNEGFSVHRLEPVV